MVVCNMFQERLAFYGKCLLSSFVMCFKSVWHFTGNAYYRRLLMCFKSVWHLTGNAYYGRL